MNKLFFSAMVAGVLVGCAHRQIPGTNIDDTDDTRAIVNVMTKYRAAVEAKDVAQIQSLVDSSFKDDGGSPSPDDDLDYATLTPKLTERFAKVDNVKLDLEIRKIDVQDGTAKAAYHYSASYLVLGRDSKAQKSDSDVKEMGFRRVNGQWLITSGI